MRSRDVFRMAERDRLILVIDEYPYLAKAEPMVSSLLQQLIDQHHGTGKLMLILSGSSMSFMERQVLGYQSPLYGRRTAQIKVMPFDYRESRGFAARYGQGGRRRGVWDNGRHPPVSHPVR